MDGQRSKNTPADVFNVDPATRIGHVHLKVANLDRTLAFCADILGLAVMQRMGDSAALLPAGDHHHHIGLNTWESLNGDPPPPGCTGSLSHGDPVPDASSPGSGAAPGATGRNSLASRCGP